MQGGRNVKNQNIQGPERQKSEFWKEHRKPHKLDFWHSDLFWRHRLFQNIESLICREHFWCSDYTYGVRKDQNVKNQKDQLLMACDLCVPRPVGVRVN